MSDVTTMTDEQILEAIKGEVAGNRVFLYMKGTPDAPACGFSMRVVQILDHLGVQYGARNILEDPRVRVVLSGWSDWPTIPQLFVNGSLVGGCDIVKEMFQSGELEDALGLSPGHRPPPGFRGSPGAAPRHGALHLCWAGLRLKRPVRPRGLQRCGSLRTGRGTALRPF